MHRTLAEGTTKWKDPADNSPLQAYGFRHGVGHFIAAEGPSAAEALIVDFGYAMARLAHEGSSGTRGMVDDYCATQAAMQPHASAALSTWAVFLRQRAHLLVRSDLDTRPDRTFMQLAWEHGSVSPLSRAAEEWIWRASDYGPWSHRADRPTNPTQDPVIAVFETGSGELEGVVDMGEGRWLSWASTGPIEVWDELRQRRLSQWDVPAEWTVTGVTRVGHDDILVWTNGAQFGRFDALSGSIAWTHALSEGSVAEALIVGDDEVWLGSWMGDVVRCPLHTGGPLKPLEGHQGTVKGLHQLSSGGVISWSIDGSIRCHEPDDGRTLFVMEGHQGWVNAVIELAGNELVSAGMDGTIRRWSAIDGSARTVLSGHEAGVVGVLLWSDSALLSWSHDGTARLWSLVSDRCIWSAEAHEFGVVGVHRLSDTHLLTWSWDETLLCWAPGTDEPPRPWTGHRTGGLGVSDAGEVGVLSWSDGGRVCVHDTTSGRVLTEFVGHTGAVKHARVTGRDRILSWTDDGTLRLWDGRARVPSPDRSKGHVEPVNGACALADGDFITWGGDGRVCRWSGSEGRLLATRTVSESSLRGARVFSSGDVVLWGSDGTVVSVAPSLDHHVQMHAHSAVVWSVEESGEGEAYSCSGDRTAIRWSTRTGSPVVRYEGHEKPVLGFKQVDHGRLLTFSADCTAALWSPEGEVERKFLGHESYVWGIIRDASDTFTTWSADGTLRTWSMDQDAAVFTHCGHERAVKGALRLADGGFISWSSDGTLRRWSGTQDAAETVYMGLHDPVTGAAVLANEVYGWTGKDRIGIWSLEGGALKGVWSADRLREASPSSFWAWAAHRCGTDPEALWMPSWRTPGFMRNLAHRIDVRPWHDTGEWHFGASSVTGSVLWTSGTAVAVVALRLDSANSTTRGAGP